MYEFTKKEIRKNFKETAYGKKTNRYLYVSLIIFLCLILIIPFIVGFICGMQGYTADSLEELVGKNSSVIMLYETIVFISLSLVLYFDGKRDGAIEQFKRGLDK